MIYSTYYVWKNFKSRGTAERQSIDSSIIANVKNWYKSAHQGSVLGVIERTVPPTKPFHQKLFIRNMSYNKFNWCMLKIHWHCLIMRRQLCYAQMYAIFGSKAFALKYSMLGTYVLAFKSWHQALTMTLISLWPIIRLERKVIMSRIFKQCNQRATLLHKVY